MENLISHAKSVAYCGILCTMFVEFPWVLLCASRISMGASELCLVSDPHGCCVTIFLWVCSSRSFAVVTMMSFRSILLRAIVGDEIFMGACIFHRLSIALLASCSCHLTGVGLQCIRLSVIMSFASPSCHSPSSSCTNLPPHGSGGSHGCVELGQNLIF